MKEFQPVGKGSESNLINCNGKLRQEKFTPLEERLADRPALADGLVRLKSAIGEENFNKDINSISNINKSERSLLVVAGSERQRTLLVRSYLPQLAAAFDVDNVQVVGGAGFGGCVDAF